jgi:hypothetical protein
MINRHFCFIYFRASFSKINTKQHSYVKLHTTEQPQRSSSVRSLLNNLRVRFQHRAEPLPRPLALAAVSRPPVIHKRTHQPSRQSWPQDCLELCLLPWLIAHWRDIPMDVMASRAWPPYGGARPRIAGLSRSTKPTDVEPTNSRRPDHTNAAIRRVPKRRRSPPDR